jgi:hypothetical protein
MKSTKDFGMSGVNVHVFHCIYAMTRREDPGIAFFAVLGIEYLCCGCYILYSTAK